MIMARRTVHLLGAGLLTLGLMQGAASAQEQGTIYYMKIGRAHV